MGWLIAFFGVLALLVYRAARKTREGERGLPAGPESRTVDLYILRVKVRRMAEQGAIDERRAGEILERIDRAAARVLSDALPKLAEDSPWQRTRLDAAWRTLADIQGSLPGSPLHWR